MSRELNGKQLLRQDRVDNFCHGLLSDLAPSGVEIGWNIEHIGRVRDAVKWVLVNDLGAMTEQEFYPFITEEDELTVENADAVIKELVAGGYLECYDDSDPYNLLYRITDKAAQEANSPS